MKAAVQFYNDILGMELLYGSPDAAFTSLRMSGGEYPILNLQEGRPTTGWGRMIFYVADVDSAWSYFKQKGFNPDTPHNAGWGERYFHMLDPDGHELSFARPLATSAK